MSIYIWHVIPMIVWMSIVLFDSFRKEKVSDNQSFIHLVSNEAYNNIMFKS